MEHPQLVFNKSVCPQRVWVNFITRKMLVLLPHWRSVSTKPDLWARMSRKWSPAQVRDMRVLDLRCHAQEDDAPVSTGTQMKTADTSSSSVVTTPQKKRKLEVQLTASSQFSSFSPMSNDNDDESHSGSCTPSIASTMSPIPDDIVKSARKAAERPVPAGRGALKALVPKVQRPARVLAPVADSDMGRIKLQLATKSSYVLACSATTSKWHFGCAKYSLRAPKDHVDIVRRGSETEHDQRQVYQIERQADIHE